MPSVKHKRTVFFEEIAKGVALRGTISHVDPLFLKGLKLYLNFSGEEIATLFGVSRQAVERKRKAAESDPRPQPAALPPVSCADQVEPGPAITQEPEAAAPPAADYNAALELSGFCDMPTEQKIAYITRKYDQCIDGQITMSKDQILALKVRLADLRTLQAEDVQEGKEHISNLLRIIMREWVADFKTAFETSFQRVKADIARLTLEAVLADSKGLRAVLDVQEENEDRRSIFKDGVRFRLSGAVSVMGSDFDIVHLFAETAKRHPAIKEQIDKYLARHHDEQVKFVGGGSIASPDSVQGGAQYRLRARHEQQAGEN